MRRRYRLIWVQILAGSHFITKAKMMDAPQKKELRQRFLLDQETIKSGKQEKVARVFKENEQWLNRVINREGWPTEERVGKEGEHYAWLIAQHAENISFQEKCLRLLQELPSTRERKQHIAYLTDRIFIKKGKQQVYGTQFQENGQPHPIVNEAHVDKRREEVGLCSFGEYKKMMQQPPNKK